MRQRLVAVILAGTALLGAATVLAGCGDSGSDEPAAAGQMQALGGGRAAGLSGLSEDVAARYRFIQAHQQEAERIPCYCSCRALGHTSLRDCFVTDGGAYEAHGSRCGVCLAEALTLETMLAQGDSIDTIRATIDGIYGGAGEPTNTP